MHKWIDGADDADDSRCKNNDHNSMESLSVSSSDIAKCCSANEHMQLGRMIDKHDSCHGARTL
eukprot:512047-Pelagomonas_calceolata.AAC.2